MKWLFGILFGSLILIGLGLGLLGSNSKSEVSDNSEALALYEEGTQLMLAYCNAQAVEKLEQALILDPSMAEAQLSLINAQTALGYRSKAQALVAEADSLTSLINDDQRRLVAQLRLSDLGLEKYITVRDSLASSLRKMEPENLYLLISEATRALRSNDKEMAEAEFLKILEVDPNYAGSYNMLGYMELRAGNFEQAIGYMQKYAFLAPNMANPHDSMGEVLMVIGRYEEAEKEFRTAISMQPDFYSSLINLGALHIARGQMKTGIKILQDLSETVSGNDIEKNILKYLVSTYYTINDTELMKAAIANYVTKFPKDHATCLYRGIRLAYSGESRLGRAVVDSCVADWRAYPGFHTRQDLQINVESMARSFDALVAELEGERATAVRMWSRVEELNRTRFETQDHWRPYYYLARALRLNGEPAEALVQINQVLQVNSRQIQSLVLATECYLDLQQIEEARRVAKQLRRSLKWADADYPALSDLQRLEKAVAEMEGNS